MLTDAIEVAVAVVGLGLVVLSFRQGRAKGWAASLQMAAGGFLLMGASAIGVVEFVVGLVFSPLAWAGVGMLAIAGVLFTVGQKLEGPSGKKSKGTDEVPQSRDAAGEVAEAPKTEAPKGKGKKKASESSGDSDLDDIEAILRKHGIE
ncbi:hypothetical protein CLV30_11833 [Haloactinopolyspora alba]|uniref:Uncharacterized protein n=1 Tax=Haloactinopolyspora alba TaxID=648780 RepID=A0A2P8DPK1_9ACTN|nr:hypothetical protein [Haloactinopolyspora alba]PSK99132.1 hypothetical protein CLV30_11833 [Haloactinopolyspora alba]